jgi:hypothetical protein
MIVAPGGNGPETGIRSDVQDARRCHPQRAEGTLCAPVLVEAERLETQEVAVESQGPIKVFDPPVRVVCAHYLHGPSLLRGSFFCSVLFFCPCLRIRLTRLYLQHHLGLACSAVSFLGVFRTSSSFIPFCSSVHVPSSS